MIIAIDGFSATGKSTIAKQLAKYLGYIHIDSGAMYRAITYYGLLNCNFDNKIDIDCLINNLNDIYISFKLNKNINEIYLNNKKIEKEIRTVEVTNNVSEIAKNKIIRDYLIKIQRKLSENQSIIMDGRDIGSTVFPNADYKFFITSSIDIRAKRRLKDFSSSNKNISLSQVKNDLLFRDKNDIERKYSPLIKDENAILIDNTYLNQEETLELILKHINF